MNKNKKLFLSNFYAASFLSAKEILLLDINRDNPKRCQFIFEKSPETEKLLEIFNFAKPDDPEVMIDARKMVIAIKSLKDKLYQNNY